MVYHKSRIPLGFAVLLFSEWYFSIVLIVCGLSKSISSSLSAALFCMSGRTWEYVSNVRLIDECPNLSDTIFGLTPAASNRVAHVCRRKSKGLDFIFYFMLVYKSIRGIYMNTQNILDNHPIGLCPILSGFSFVHMKWKWRYSVWICCVMDI